MQSAFERLTPLALEWPSPSRRVKVPSGERMPIGVWLIAAAAGVAAVAVLVLIAPARASILVDTTASTARVDIWPLWGLLPRHSSRILPRAGAGSPLAVFNDAGRIGHALMTPGVADVAYDAIRRLFEMKPRVARFALAMNLGDHAKNLVVQTAAQAALAAAPGAMRENVLISKCEAPGAELSARFELSASPLALWSIWRGLKGSRAAREFRRRLRRKPKPPKKPVREVRAS